jgi:hypothetical protein
MNDEQKILECYTRLKQELDPLAHEDRMAILATLSSEALAAYQSRNDRRSMFAEFCANVKETMKAMVKG